MIGVIGCGTMAQAIVKGFYKENKTADFLTYTPSFSKANELAKVVNGKAVKTLKELWPASTIILACKPQQLNSLVKDLNKENFDLSDKHIISILAATSMKTLKEKLNAKTISRVMPNTPALIGQGLSLVLHDLCVQENQKIFVKSFFDCCGKVVQMPNEKLFDQVTTISGSGPAYVFLFAQSMFDKLINFGVDPLEARKIVTSLFKGSAELINKQNELSLDQLIANVTSKGGITIEAVNIFKESGLSDITSNAIDAAYKRSLEIESENKK